MRLTTITVGLLVAVGLAIAGFAIINFPGIDQACSGAVYDTNLCESARLRGAIFASALTAAAIISAALLVATYLMSSTRGRRSHDSTTPTAEPAVSANGETV